MKDRQTISNSRSASRGRTLAKLCATIALATAAFSLALFAVPGDEAGAQSATPTGTVSVEITNLTNGIYFTPFLVSAHDDATHLFEVGQAASTSLQAMAEGGDISGLSTDLGGADLDTIENPAGGVLAPGGSTTATLDTSTSGNTHLSLVAMLLPTNDGFVGLDALEIPTTPGTYVMYLKAYDAGTEANDELMNTVDGGTPGNAGIPADPTGLAGSGGTGVAGADDNSNVHVHRGVIGDTNLLSGASDLDSTSHRWLNPVARVVITVE